MITIKDQIISSTKEDLQGDKLSKEELKYLFDQLPEEQELKQEHHLSLPPLGKMYNKKFVKIENGEYAIKVDIDILSQEHIKNMGGFSISYTKQKLTVNPKKEGDITVFFNPHYFDKEDIKGIVNLSDDSIQIDAVELYQKGLETAAVIVLAFVTTAFLNGFFSKQGADLYDSLKQNLKELAEKRKSKFNSDTIFHITVYVPINSNKTKVIIELRKDDLNIEKDIIVNSALNYVKNIVGESEVKEVALSILQDEPYWTIKYFKDSKGDIVRLS